MAESEGSNLISEKISNIKTHGFPNAYAASNWPRCVVWLIITFVAMAFSLYGIVTTTMRYYTYPVVVELSFKDEALATFPAVTLCNLNLKRKSQGKSRRWLFSSVKPDRLSEEDRASKGHQLVNMLRYCNYKGIGCDDSHFVLVNGSIGRYGNCYTFKSGLGKTVVSRNELATGRGGSFQMILDLEPDEYSSTTQGSGFKIILHDSGQFPTPEAKTVSIAPGFATFIELTQVRFSSYFLPVLFHHS